jgi:hypothetical protein
MVWTSWVMGAVADMTTTQFYRVVPAIIRKRSFCKTRDTPHACSRRHTAGQLHLAFKLNPRQHQAQSSQKAAT